MSAVTDVPIHTEFIRLQDFLKFTGAAETGGQAKLAVQNGEVSVNGETCTQRGRKLRNGDTVGYQGMAYRVTADAAAGETPHAD